MYYYRPAPLDMEDNHFLNLFKTSLQHEGWCPLDFKFWSIRELFQNRDKCKLIHMHWPEGFWRSDNVLLCLVKACWFIGIFYISKLFNYKWAWSAHNVVPHLGVRSYRLERWMRVFILKHFDLIIGLAYNTKNDLELAYGTSGKRYILGLHGTYEQSYPVTMSKEEFRQKLNIPLASKVILAMNTMGRDNKGTDDLLTAWLEVDDKADVCLLLTGVKPSNLSALEKRKNFRYIEGKIPNEMMGNLFTSVDFLFLNYKSITTSGAFLLAVTFDLPTIVPNLPFFKLHASDKVALFFDYNEPLSNQIAKLVDNITGKSWQVDFDALQQIKENHNTQKAAKTISTAFYSLLYS